VRKSSISQYLNITIVNFKLLFPTYRNRYKFVAEQLNILKEFSIENALNLGAGEGDYDPMIANYTKKLTSCDINESDVLYAKQLNASLKNTTYQVENALQLSFPDDYFDLIVTCEVIEHVGQPVQMLREIARTLKPNGFVILTYPSNDFPVTYDPINRFFQRMGMKKRIAQGAFAFGHEYLIKPDEFREWIDNQGFIMYEERTLSGYLVGLLEMYWTGIAQSIFKANAKNLTGSQKGFVMRPSTDIPALVKVTDSIIYLDKLVSGNSKYSQCRGYLLQKKVISDK
jgi:2-polyprenyl-3-methyl-5-hydroxy-6-metoxy-1,4-benzoquinol methylase